MIRQSISHSVDPYHTRPTRRIMGFADGENLVYRYQAMKKTGLRPRDDMFHECDVVIWHPTFTCLAQHHEILRVTYYTSAVGDDNKIQKIKDDIRTLSFMKHQASMLPNFLTPCVFKKVSKYRKTKGVDIRICVDVLSHVYQHDIEAVLLLAGDGDYEPLIDEVLRHGVQVFLSAFSEGLNLRLRNKVDQFLDLDGVTWQAPPRKKTRWTESF